MKKAPALFTIIFISTFFSYVSLANALPKIAIWDLEPGNTLLTQARELTSILVSEISKLGKYEVYSQENLRTIAGWNEQKVKLGCTNPECLTALGQLDFSKLISGSVEKIGNRYSISLSLFDTQKTKAENAVSEFGNFENELIGLVQIAVRNLFGEPSGIILLPKSIESNAITASTSKVRETGRDGRFIAYENGTVLDTGTNLMWAAKDNGSDVNWRKAKSYCEKYLGGGYTDWRMPKHNELAGLYDSSKSYQVRQQSYHVHLTELIQLSANAPWTSETRFSLFGSEAGAFHFGSGSRFWVPQSYTDSYRALPVRSGK